MPNPVLLKGNMPEIKTLKDFLIYSFTWLINLFKYFHILLITFTILFSLITFFKKDKNGKKRYIVMSIAFLLILTSHLQFARVGWLYRYEAYLMAIGILISIILIKKMESLQKMKKVEKVILILLLTISIALFSFRGLHAVKRTILATKNIHDQQYQMGLFLKNFYQKHCVALNDIGAANFLADLKCIDLCGLANRDIFKTIKKNEYNTYNVSKITSINKVEIAIAFKNWFKGEFPSNWIEVGAWQIKNNVICEDDTIHFFGTNERNAKILLQNLKKFSKKLPEDVIQKGLYCE